MKAIHAAAVGFACALAAPCVHAVGWYVSAAGGLTELESGLEAGHGIGFDPSSTFTMTPTRGTWRVAVGASLTQRFALEASYTDYGRQRLKAVGSPNPIVFPVEVLSQTRTSDRKVTAVGADLVVRLPLRHGFLASGRVGGAYVTTDLDSRIAAPGGFPFGSGPQSISTTSRDRKLVPRAALGLACSPATDWDLEVNYEYLARSGSDFTAGRLDRTGRASQTTAWLVLARRF